MTSPATLSDRRAPHRVVLVREWDEQHSGSGCCGRLGGMGELGGAVDYAATRATMERMGEVYRALRRELGSGAVDIQVVDPRNTAWLVPVVYRDARRIGLSRRVAWRNVFAATSPSAVVCDGEVLFRGEPPSPDAAVDAVLRALGRHDAGG